MSGPKFNQGAQVRCVAPIGTRNRDHYGHVGKVLDSNLAPTYEVEFTSGIRRMVHAADLVAVKS